MPPLERVPEELAGETSPPPPPGAAAPRRPLIEELPDDLPHPATDPYRSPAHRARREGLDLKRVVRAPFDLGTVFHHVTEDLDGLD